MPPIVICTPPLGRPPLGRPRALGRGSMQTGVGQSAGSCRILQGPWVALTRVWAQDPAGFCRILRADP
eukprot:57280-Pyramimonas_sp.AAC.1